MRRYARPLISAALMAMATPAAAQNELCETPRRTPFVAAEAWGEFRNYIERNYAYLDRVDSRRILDSAAPGALTTRSDSEFSAFLQRLVLVWRDGHFQVTPSPRPVRAWIPSAADLWVERRSAGYVVVDVKTPSLAERAGLRPGMTIETINGTPIDAPVEAVFAPLGITVDAALRDYAANAILAGHLGTPRTVTARLNGTARTITLAPGYDSTRLRPSGLLTVRQEVDAKQRRVTVIRPNDSLGDNGMIAAFDAAITEAGQASAIILDLRDTPGGGNTTVARAIIGHFTRTERGYQRHDNSFERVTFGVPRRTLELVAPRAPYFTGRLIVLAGRWTGSMGEGLTIGLDAIEGVRTVGAPLADLLGDLQKHALSSSCLTVQLAWNRLSHIDGRAREAYLPQHLLPSADLAPDGSDPAMAKALALLSAD